MKSNRRPSICLVALFGLAVSLAAQSGSVDDQDLQFLQKLKQTQPTVEKGVDRYTAGDRAGARRLMEKCLQVLPQHHQALFMLAQIRYDEKDFAAALALIAEAEVGFQRYREVLGREEQILRKIKESKLQEMAAFADALFQRGAGACSPDFWRRESRAVSVQADALRNQQSAPPEVRLRVPTEYAYLHGNILFRLQRLPEAEARYQDAIGTNSRHVASYNNLINIYLLSRRFDEARRWLAQAEANQVALNGELAEAVRRAR